MFEDAKVVTSKFLQLKDKLDKEVASNECRYSPGIGNGYKDYVRDANIKTVVEMFGELCELLHDLTVK